VEALAYNHAYAAYEEAAGIEYDLPEWELNWKPPSSAWIGLLAAIAAISVLSTTGAAFAISAGRYYVSSGSSLNVRTSPNGYIIKTLRSGQAVDLNGRTSGSWAQTVPRNWVHTSLLSGSNSGSNSGGYTGGQNVLGRGSKGSAVTDVQTRLRDIGYRISVDGDYGSRTQEAVRRFQSRNGLLADGRVGGQTRAALFGTGRIMNPR
jgi:uncharacterized protein YgiM (DUF1202 family)